MLAALIFPILIIAFAIPKRLVQGNEEQENIPSIPKYRS